MAVSVTTTVTLGGSDAAAACGLDRYRSRVQLWCELTGRTERPPAGEAAEWGQILQPLLAQRLEAVSDYAVMPAPADPFVHPDHEWMRGHLDGFAANGERGVLELKTCSLRLAPAWDDDHIPLHYQAQGLHYLAVTGLPYVVYGCLIGGQQFVIRRLDRDDEAIGLLIQQEEAFLRYVTDDEPPPPAAADTDLLKRLYPDARERATMPIDHLPDVQKRYRSAKRAVKAAEEELAQVENEIKAELRDCEIATIGGEPAFKWTQVGSHRLDGRRLKEELPDVHAAYWEPTSYRRFQEV